MFPYTGCTHNGLLDPNIVNMMVRGTTNLVVQRKYLPKYHGYDPGIADQAKANLVKA